MCRALGVRVRSAATRLCAPLGSSSAEGGAIGTGSCRSNSPTSARALRAASTVSSVVIASSMSRRCHGCCSRYNNGSTPPLRAVEVTADSHLHLYTEKGCRKRHCAAGVVGAGASAAWLAGRTRQQCIVVTTVPEISSMTIQRGLGMNIVNSYHLRWEPRACAPPGWSCA